MTTARKVARELGQRLRDDWRSIARPAQLEPLGNWTVWLLMSGRGFGKTRAGASCVNEQVEAGVKRTAVIGTTASAREMPAGQPSADHASAFLHSLGRKRSFAKAA